MTRKFSKLLHTTNGTLNCCFDLIGSHQQCIPWTPPLEIEPATTETQTLSLGYQFMPHISDAKSTSHGCIRPIWEDSALNGAVSSVRKNVLSRHIRSCGRAFLPWLVDSASLMCGMDWWPSDRVLVSVFCSCWCDLQWWRSRYTLLMRPNKVETAVRCSVCHM